MINFRFHLVSLVAVFLAIGVGVAMGASFVDRATVDSMRNSLDQLEENYRHRGVEIDDLKTQLREVDESDAKMFGDDSALLDGLLADRSVVVIAPSTLSEEAMAASWGVLENAGAVRGGTLLLEPSLDLADAEALTRTRELLDLDSATPSLVRGRLLSRLASSLADFTAAAPDPAPEAPADEGDDAAPTTTAPTTTEPGFRPLGPQPTVEEVAASQRFVLALVDAGLLSLDTRAVAAGEEFPGIAEVSYVMLLEDGTDSAAVGRVHRLAQEVAEAAPATVTVAEAAAPREPGALSTTDEARVGAMLVELRNDDEAVDRLSTVDDLEEAVGRVALVLAVAEQSEGRVGHYGIGVGAQAPLPTAGP